MSAMRKRVVLKCFCCTSSCVQVSGLYTYHTGISAATYGLSDIDSDSLIRYTENGYKSCHRCYRLLIYEGISVASDIIGTVGSPDYVLATNRSLDSFIGGPFNELGEDSGDLLDAPPYWYAACNIGGRALSTVGREPTTANLNTFWAATPIPNGTYTIAVQTLTRRRYRKASHPSGYDEIPTADAQYQIRRIYIF